MWLFKTKCSICKLLKNKLYWLIIQNTTSTLPRHLFHVYNICCGDIGKLHLIKEACFFFEASWFILLCRGEHNHKAIIAPGVIKKKKRSLGGANVVGAKAKRQLAKKCIGHIRPKLINYLIDKKYLMWLWSFHIYVKVFIQNHVSTKICSEYTLCFSLFGKHFKHTKPVNDQALVINYS